MTINVSPLPTMPNGDQRIPHTLILLIRENAAMTEQLSLLDWRLPAEILPFPLHRSHGATIAYARTIYDLDTPKRSGKLNSLRAQTRKRFEPLIGPDAAEAAADDLIRVIKVGFAYCDSSIPKPSKVPAVILSLTGQRIESSPHGYGGGKAIACVPRPQALVAEGSEQESARVREGGAA
jgi:hypothetical protein